MGATSSNTNNMSNMFSNFFFSKTYKTNKFIINYNYNTTKDDSNNISTILTKNTKKELYYNILEIFNDDGKKKVNQEKRDKLYNFIDKNKTMQIQVLITIVIPSNFDSNNEYELKKFIFAALHNIISNLFYMFGSDILKCSYIYFEDHSNKLNSNNINTIISNFTINGKKIERLFRPEKHDYKNSVYYEIWNKQIIEKSSDETFTFEKELLFKTMSDNPYLYRYYDYDSHYNNTKYNDDKHIIHYNYNASNEKNKTLEEIKEKNDYNNIFTLDYTDINPSNLNHEDLINTDRFKLITCQLDSIVKPNMNLYLLITIVLPGKLIKQDGNLKLEKIEYIKTALKKSIPFLTCLFGEKIFKYTNILFEDNNNKQSGGISLEEYYNKFKNNISNNDSQMLTRYDLGDVFSMAIIGKEIKEIDDTANEHRHLRDLFGHTVYEEHTKKHYISKNGDVFICILNDNEIQLEYKKVFFSRSSVLQLFGNTKYNYDDYIEHIKLRKIDKNEIKKKYLSHKSKYDEYKKKYDKYKLKYLSLKSKLKM